MSAETNPSPGTRHAAELYGRISQDAELTQSLFRQALQDPSGAMARIVAIGAEQGLSVSTDDVKQHLASLEDGATQRWVVKALGGL